MSMIEELKMVRKSLLTARNNLGPSRASSDEEEWDYYTESIYKCDAIIEQMEKAEPVALVGELCDTSRADALRRGYSVGQYLFTHPAPTPDEITKLREQLAAVDNENKQLWKNCASLSNQLAATQTEVEALRKLAEAKMDEVVRLRKDAERLDWIEREYVQVDTFAMPTAGGDDADVGWTLKQWHMGEKVPRLIHRHYSDDLRSAIDAAMQPAADEAGKGE